MKHLKFLFILFTLIIPAIIQAQDWENNVNTNISYSGDAFQYDLVGSEMGFHLAVCENNQIKYYLLGADGSIIRERNIGSSGMASPAIAYQYFNGDKLHIICHDKNDEKLKIYQSADDGDSWSFLTEKELSDFGTTSNDLRIDTVGDEDGLIHITLGDAKPDETGIFPRGEGVSSDQEVYYISYDLEYSQWSFRKVVTDVSNAQTGWNPTIVLSEKQGVQRIHVIFEMSITIEYGEENTATFEQVVERHKPSTQSGWTSRDIISKSSEDPDWNTYHKSAHYSHPVCAVYQENLYVAHRFENTQFSVSQHYYYTVVKMRAVDDTSRLEYNAGGHSEYGYHDENAFGYDHALHVDNINGAESLFWANIRDNELVWQQATGPDPDFNNPTYISDGMLPMLTSNKATELFAVWQENNNIYIKRKSRPISGIITENTLWSGNIYVDGDVTVNAGVTLTIIKGTEIKFAPNTDLTVYGTLLAVGEADNRINFTSSSSNWSGITLSGTGADNSALSYCTIENVVTYGGAALRIQNCSPEIEYCIINDNQLYGTAGIYVYNGSPTIYYNTINNNGYHGIYLNGSNAYICRNTIQYNNNSGVWCNNFSSPNFGKPGYYPGDNNVISNNYKGVSASYYSDPRIGSTNNSYYQNNTLMLNTNANCYAENHSEVMPELVWWGDANPDLSKIQADATSSIDYIPYLGSSPLSKQSPSMLSEVIKLIIEQKYDAAIELCKTIITEQPESNDAIGAIVELLNVFRETGDNTIITICEDVKSKYKELNMVTTEVLWKMNMLQGNYANSLTLIDAYLTETTDKNKNLFAFLDKFYLYLNDTDYSKASKVLDQLKKEYSDDINIAVAEMILTNAEITLPKKMQPQFNEPEDSAYLPSQFVLAQNYPNPFNPTTSISYSMPEASRAIVKVYNINGQCVAELTDRVYQAGKHTLQFDAGNLTSGMYFTRVQIIPVENPLNPYVFTRKMMLLK